MPKSTSFKGEKVERYKSEGGAIVVSVKYRLSKEQSEISKKIKENYLNGIDTLVEAVCGAGKTELIYDVMSAALANHKIVAFAVPRRDVVIELMPRIKAVFPSNTIVAVYGGHTSVLRADIVVLTTHQLYRYSEIFDLIILDEIDAFPFKDNDLLFTMFKNANRGRIVMMSATPSIEVLQEFSTQNHEILHLNTRFHHHPLPVPVLDIKYGFYKYMSLVRKMHQFVAEKKPVFVFCPTIKLAETVFNFLDKVFPGGSVVHSKLANRSSEIIKFKNGNYKYLVTTAVLERGVTIKNLQVIVFDADHSIYDEQSLIQIAGRVGRKYDAPEGEVIFIANKSTEAIKNAIQTIKSKNESL